MLRRFLVTLTFALACSGLLGSPVMAAPPQPAHMLMAKGPDKNRGGGIISAKQAANQAQRQFGGRVLSVKLRDNSGDPFYAVKLIKDGQVKIIYIPARN